MSTLSKITNSHLFQINEPLINVGMKENDEDIVSNWLNERIFISLRNNTFSACYASKNRVAKKDIDTLLKINVQYQDYSEKGKRVHVLDFQNNKTTTDVGEVLDLNVSPNSETLIKGNHFTLLGFTAGRTDGIVITGINKPEFADMNPPSFTFENNHISGFMTAISLKGQLNLDLKSNQLNGKYLALGREDYQIYPIKLSGDNNNSYLPGVYAPCEGLERTSIEGGFIFSDGMPCPSSYVANTPSFSLTPMTSLAAAYSYARTVQSPESTFSGVQTTGQITSQITTHATLVTPSASGRFSVVSSTPVSQSSPTAETLSPA